MLYPNAAVAPLFIYGLTERFIWQSSEFRNTPNTITVRLATSIAQEPPTKITVSGLFPTKTASGTLTLTDLNSTGVFDLSAAWEKDAGKLEIVLLTTMSAGTVYTLSFQVFCAPVFVFLWVCKHATAIKKNLYEHAHILTVQYLAGDESSSSTRCSSCADRDKWYHSSLHLHSCASSTGAPQYRPAPDYWMARRYNWASYTLNKRRKRNYSHTFHIWIFRGG